MRMSTLANSPGDELFHSEGSVDVTPHASPIDMYIGSCVRIRRTWRGMTQKDLSELLDVDCDNLAAYEAGVERINVKLLSLLWQIYSRRLGRFRLQWGHR